MTNLPQLVNTPIELEINGVKIQAKRAGFKELALLEEFNAKARNEHPESANLKFLPYAVYLCVKKVYPEVEEDFINDLIPATFIMEKPELSNEIMVKLGFMLPPKAKM